MNVQPVTPCIPHITTQSDRTSIDDTEIRGRGAGNWSEPSWPEWDTADNLSAQSVCDCGDHPGPSHRWPFPPGPSLLGSLTPAGPGPTPGPTHGCSGSLTLVLRWVLRPKTTLWGWRHLLNRGDDVALAPTLATAEFLGLCRGLGLIRCTGTGTNCCRHHPPGES